jgi:hypothetical protein
MVYLEILLTILAMTMMFLFITGILSFCFDNVILGFVCLLFGVCAFLSLFPIEKEIIKKEEEYKKYTVTEAHSATVKKLEYEQTKIKSGTGFRTEDSMIMILEDGTVGYINSKLYASLSEGMEVYWDVCMKNCDYFSDKRNYYIKDE